MSAELQSRITPKIFIGCLFTSDLKLLLSKSHGWKEAQIMKKGAEEDLQETMFQNKRYLGFYSEGFGKTLNEIERVKLLIKEKIMAYCPDYELEKLNFFIFPQVFVA